MIIKLKEKVTEQKEIYDIQCEHCRQTHMQFSAVTKTVHIFGVPLFNVKKKVNILCNYCKTNTEFRELDRNTRKQIMNEIFKKNIKKGSIKPTILIIVILNLM